MPGTTIGISMNLGYPGSRGRNYPAESIVSRPVLSTAPVLFGVPVKLNADSNSYDAMIGTDAFTAFAGVAFRNVKQATIYASNASGQYNQNEACDVMTQGYVTVSVNPSASLTAGGAVFAIFDHTTHDFKYFDTVTGDGTTTDGVQLTNCEWSTGYLDANKVAEMYIKTANHG